jgi:hypothetical protein
MERVAMETIYLVALGIPLLIIAVTLLVLIGTHAIIIAISRLKSKLEERE